MKIVLAQLTPTPDPGEGCARIRDTIGTSPGADLVMFPELFVGGYASRGLEARSIEAGGPQLAAITAACRDTGTGAVFGFVETLGGGRFANSAACIDADGSLAGIYRKTHLFGTGEQTGFEAGDALLLTRVCGRSVGPLICFDIEFPEPARKLALAGADLLVSIAANMKPYANDHRLTVRARALENRLPHLYVNRTGSEGGFDFVGESCLVSPDGTVVAELGPDEGLLEVEIPAPEPPGDAKTDYLSQIRPNLEVNIKNQPHGEER